MRRQEASQNAQWLIPQERSYRGLYLSDDGIVVSAAQSSVSSDDDQQHCLDWSDGDKRGVNLLYPEPLVDAK